MLDGDLAWALAMEHLHFEWEGSDRELLAPLIDATIMRVECERLEEIARPLVEALWSEVRPLIEQTLVDQAKRSDFVADALDDALADLELGPRRTRLGVDVLAQAAVDLADDAFFLEDCLDCIEHGLGHAPPERHPGLVARAAAALALHGAPDYGIEPPADDERSEARRRVRTLAALGRESLPKLVPALEDIAAEPLPPPARDRVLQAVLQRRRARVAELN
jgi:hypothetical protein